MEAKSRGEFTKAANQNKADATISELQHTEKLRLSKQGLEQKI